MHATKMSIKRAWNINFDVSIIGFSLFVIVTLSHRTVAGDVQPEQVHLSYTEDDPTSMVVTWVTFNMTTVSVVEYGNNTLDKVAMGVPDAFEDGGSEGRVLWMHRVKMTGLEPGEKYVYHVGGPGGWSNLFGFQAMPNNPNWGPRMLIYGDMGNENAKSMAHLQEEAQMGKADFVLHVGDFAYDLDTDNARIGDAFMKQIESIAAYIPYMTSVGNHEEKYNFSNYQARFSMPKAGGDGHNLWFSFNAGPIHFVSFSSEVYYYPQYGLDLIGKQYNWLENDLKEANRAENRAKRPWIISMCHRPMYCGNSDDPEHCTNLNNYIRRGIPYSGGVFAPEDLIYKYGVDVHLQAHEHSYERMWPVYNLTVCNGSRENPYTNPNAPVHIVTGSAGCREEHDPFRRHLMPWSAFHTVEYGYTRMNVVNSTHLYMEQVSAEKGNVIDRMTLIKSKHGAGLYDCHTRQKDPGDLKSYPTVWAGL